MGENPLKIKKASLEVSSVKSKTPPSEEFFYGLDFSLGFS